jgi:hypothetical protein
VGGSPRFHTTILDQLQEGFTSWTHELSNESSESSTGVLVFRGLRVRMGMHSGAASEDVYQVGFTHCAQSIHPALITCARACQSSFKSMF